MNREKRGNQRRSTQQGNLTRKIKRKATYIFITVFFSIYSLATVYPFYALFISTFITPRQSRDLHLWIPKTDPLSLNTTFTGLQQVFNLKIKDFLKAFDLPSETYVKPNMTIREVMEEYNLDEKKVRRYFEPLNTFRGWLIVLRDTKFYRSIVSSFIITTGTFLGEILFTTMTALIIARFKRRWHFLLYSFYLIQMVIPRNLRLIPVYIFLTGTLGLYDNYLSIFLQWWKGAPLGIMIFTSYFSSIPKELEDSVEIDGGNRLHYLYYILFPMMMVPVGSLAVIRIPQIWNLFLEPLIYLKQTKYNLVAYVNIFAGTYTSNLQAIYTTVLVSILPLLIFYLLARNLFIRGLLSGSIKG